MLEPWLEILGHLSKCGAVDLVWLTFIIYTAFKVFFFMPNELKELVGLHFTVIV